MHGAGAALRYAATVLGALEIEFITEGPQEGHIRRHVDGAHRAVDFETDGHGGKGPGGRRFNLTPTGELGKRWQGRKPRRRQSADVLNTAKGPSRSRQRPAT